MGKQASISSRAALPARSKRSHFFRKMVGYFLFTWLLEVMDLDFANVNFVTPIGPASASVSFTSAVQLVSNYFQILYIE